jgi:hypothetical protein
MSSFLPPAARAFVAQASRIPTSFKDVFLETRQVLGLRAQRARGTKLSRREELLIETNTQSLSYLLAFFLAQVPPVIGWLPVFVALQYPRQLLTSHFHTPEQIDAFLAAEYQERTQLSLELRDYIVRRCVSFVCTLHSLSWQVTRSRVWVCVIPATRPSTRASFWPAGPSSRCRRCPRSTAGCSPARRRCTTAIR